MPEVEVRGRSCQDSLGGREWLESVETDATRRSELVQKIARLRIPQLRSDNGHAHIRMYIGSHITSPSHSYVCITRIETISTYTQQFGFQVACHKFFHTCAIIFFSWHT